MCNCNAHVSLLVCEFRWLHNDACVCACGAALGEGAGVDDENGFHDLFSLVLGVGKLGE
jgi:hypothetical protein